MAAPTLKSLKKSVYGELVHSGWHLNNGGPPVAPKRSSKRLLRSLHREQRIERTTQESRLIASWGPKLLKHFASGKDVHPENISPVLVPIPPGADTEDAYLFRYAALLWSIPVSKGYGRRIRFILRDKANGKLIGLLALGDPVFNLRVRDNHIGWALKERERRLFHVMDSYVLGAVPPYNELLGGKLVALSALSDEVRAVFAEKYRDSTSLIRREVHSPHLVLVTTTSALGRSSIYNRLKLNGRVAFESLGYTSGYGHFHFSVSLFEQMRKWLKKRKDEYGSNYKFGDGPNWRLRAIRKVLDAMAVGGDLLHHGVKREVFIAPLASNYKEFLRGEVAEPSYYSATMKDIGQFWKERWAIPRAQRLAGSWIAWKAERIPIEISRHLAVNQAPHRNGRPAT